MEVHIACLTRACEDIGLTYQFLDEEHNFVRVGTKSAPLYFQQNKTPFNTSVMASICTDKEHSYKLLKKSISMPKTMGFLDYKVAAKYHKYLNCKSLDEIIAKIEKEFTYPMVIKKNRGGLGVHVFLCQDRAQVETSLKIIYDKNSSEYDYVALAQEYLPYEKEFRLVCFRGEALLLYERISGNPTFNARYWEADNGRSEHITDQKTIDSLLSFVRPALGITGLEYIGFDILMSKEGRYYLLELNSGPKYNHFVEGNGPEPVVAMYRRILNSALNET